jgi:hypothetical protein
MSQQRTELSTPYADAKIVDLSKRQWERLWTFYTTEEKFSLKALHDLGFLSLWCWEIGAWVRVLVDDGFIASLKEEEHKERISQEDLSLPPGIIRYKG